MLENPISARVGCVRMFKVRVLSGMERAYADYIRDIVEPIDRIAHAADAFLDVVTVVPDGADPAGWTQARIFTFRDEAQRAALPVKMGAAAASFDGSAEATARRKQFAETLREQIAVSDYALER
jgi:hypothetical protein